MPDFLGLAIETYAYAEANYSKKDARYDVIVECMGKSEIVDALREAGADTLAKAKRWADEKAGLMHEVELNQAWDGPESVRSSSRYDPRHDPAGPVDEYGDTIDEDRPY